MPARERKRPTSTSMLTPHPEPLATGGDASPGSGSPGSKTPAETLVYLSGRVPKSLRDELKRRAIDEDRPLADLLADAVRNYLQGPV